MSTSRGLVCFMYWNPSWGPHLSKYIMSYKKKKERTFSLGIDIFKNICMITVFYDFKFTRIMSFYLKSLQCLIQNTQSQGCWENVNNEEGTSWWYGHVCNDSSDKTLIFLFWKWCSTLGKTFNPAVCVWSGQRLYVGSTAGVREGSTTLRCRRRLSFCL